MKMQIGLLTAYKYNYGSVLQCYATKRYIESLGFSCTVMFHRKKKLANAPNHMLKALRYRGYIHNYMLASTAVKEAPLRIPSDAMKKMNQFISDVLSPKGYTWRQLKRIGHESDYAAFIAGSDQIWNVSTLPEHVFFLTFTKPSKRIALSASFGIPCIPKHNIKAVKKLLSGFARISVREESGAEIVKQLIQVPVVRLADPVLFFTASQWRSFSESAEIPSERYIFVHFIDVPSKCAVRAIDEFAKEAQCRILCFTYPHEGIDRNPLSFHIDGSPIDYVGLIDRAAAVFTDSFHTTMFSILLNKEFFSFSRQYRHNNPQSCRVTDLLQRYDLKERYITDDPDVSYIKRIVWDGINARLNVEREHLQAWLEAELNKKFSEEEGERSE